MNLTAIKHFYLANRAVKKASFPVQYLHLLYTIYILQPASFGSIQKTLIRCKREIGRSNFTPYLQYLLNNNYIRKDESNKYCITTAGLSALKEIETRLRNERHDK